MTVNDVLSSQVCQDRTTARSGVIPPVLRKYTQVQKKAAETSGERTEDPEKINMNAGSAGNPYTWLGSERVDQSAETELEFPQHIITLTE